MKLPAKDITEVEIKNFIENIKDRTTKIKVSYLLSAMYKLAINKKITEIHNNPVKTPKTTKVKFEQNHSSSNKMTADNSEQNILFNQLSLDDDKL